MKLKEQAVTGMAKEKQAQAQGDHGWGMNQVAFWTVVMVIAAPLLLGRELFSFSPFASVTLICVQ
jgi:hypothetical protein